MGSQPEDEEHPYSKESSFKSGSLKASLKESSILKSPRPSHPRLHFLRLRAEKVGTHDQGFRKLSVP